MEPLDRYVFRNCRNNHNNSSSNNSSEVDGIPSDILPLNNNNDTNNRTWGTLRAVSRPVECSYALGSRGVWQSTHPFQPQLMDLMMNPQQQQQQQRSLSLWWYPYNHVEPTIPFLTIGSSNNNNATSSSCPDLQLAQYQSFLVLTLWDGTSCRVAVLRSHTVNHSSLTQVVVTFTNQSTRLYLHNETIFTAWVPTPLLQWHGDSHLMVQATDPAWLVQLSWWDSNDNAMLDTTTLHPLDVGLGADDTTIIIAQDDSTTPHGVWLSSRNVSTPNLPLAVQIENLPIATLVAFTCFNQTVTFGSVFPIPIGDDTIPCTCTLPNNTNHTFFTDPQFNGRNHSVSEMVPSDNSLEYRIVALLDSTSIVPSSVISQRIHIRHVNHSPTLVAPLQFNVSNPSHIVVHGIELRDDDDYDFDRVRVDVWAAQGRLTLVASSTTTADFDTCRYRTMSSWQCVGDGKANRNMTFLAFPSAVNALLHGMVYQGLVWGQDDEVVVRVSDGVGNGCLSESEHTTSVKDEWGNDLGTIRRECFQVKVVIRVPSFPATNPVDDSGILGIPNLDWRNFGLADLLFWVVVLIVVCTCCSCLKNQSKRRLARGSDIDADDGQEDEVSELEDETCSRAHTI